MLVEILAARSWSLLLAPKGLGFVCSDRPVSLLNNRNLPAVIQPRFDDLRFHVIMPLSRGIRRGGRHCNPVRVSRASPRTFGLHHPHHRIGGRRLRVLPAADVHDLSDI